MRLRYLPSLFTALLLTALPLNAVVFLSAPGTSNRTPGAADMPGIDQKSLMTERVNINGHNTEMRIYQLRTTLAHLHAHFRNRFPGLILRSGSNYLIAKPASGIGDLWLFVSGGKELPLTAFNLYLKNKLPPPPEFPAELPPPPAGAIPEQVIRLNDRNAVFASFYKISGTPHRNLISCNAVLRARGFQPVGAEASPAIRGNGDIFVKFNNASQEVILATFGAGGNGFYYYRKIK